MGRAEPEQAIRPHAPSHPGDGHYRQPTIRGRRVASIAMTVLAGAAVGVLTLVAVETSLPSARLALGSPGCPGGARRAPFGVGAQVHPLWSDADAYPKIDQLLAAAGASWVRIDVGWDRVEPARGRFSDDEVAAVGRAVDDANRNGLRVLVTFWASPGWANGGRPANIPPSDPGDYSSAVAHLAADLAGRVAAWEVWNEPNVSQFFSGSAASYAAILRAAGPAIRNADPRATVVLGGPSTNDTTWLAKLYAAGIAGAYDAVAVHPYPSPSDEPPTLADDGSRHRFSHLAAFRRVMVANGDADVPLWITEVGWSTGQSADREDWNRGVTPAVQAADLTATLEIVAKCYPFVEVVIWYNARDRADGSPRDRGFGLLTRGLDQKPSYTAFTAFTTTEHQGVRR
jgi:polysaccharide biosynthesis protein PslG